VQKLAELCIRLPVFASMIVLSLVVIGIASYFQLDIDKHPEVELPTVSIRTNLPGASPEEVEVSITQVIEEAVNTVEGITEIRSNAGQGTSNVIVTFNLNRDIETATQDIRDRVNTVLRLLPDDAQPPVISKFNADQSPSLSLALVSDRPLRELNELADKVIKEQLERSAGVGEVKINGGLERAINVSVDPDRLAAYQLPINAVYDAIVRQNADVPGGNVTSGLSETNLRTIGRMRNAEDFNDLVVTTINGAPVRIRDIGNAEDGTKEQRSSSRLNGKRTVSMEIRRQSGANTVEVIEGVKKTLKKIETQLPPDVKLEIIEDQSGFIYAALHEIKLIPYEQRVFSWERLVAGIVHLHPAEAFRHNISQRDVMTAARRQLSRYRDVKFQVINIQTINLSGAGGRTDIGFLFRGPEVEKLVEYAQKLADRGPELGLLDAQVSLQLNRPELRLEVDRHRAADLNADIQSIASAMRLMVGGDEKVSRFHDASINEDYDVQLRLADGYRNDLDTISRLYVPSRTGRLIRLDNLVTVRSSQSVSQINRFDRQRQVTLQASVAPGYGLADRNQAIVEAARDLNMPAGYSTMVTGRGRELERTFGEFLIAFSLSVIFMYMILASLYESLTHPLTILLSLPLAVPFALFSLWATGQSLNLYSALGMLVLFGVVKKNAILQIDHMNQLRAEGLPKLEAILEGNRDRLRPILMTTMALVGGMLPLALGTGPGAEERRAVAVAVIGGQSLSLLLTLLMCPVAYSLIDDLTAWLHNRAKASLAQRSLKSSM
jgi:multidrug efflux pump subunit AcrB